MKTLSSSPDCSFCFCPESLLHVISGCKAYLDEGRFTWRHNSVLNFITSSLLNVERSKLYVHLPGFISPSVITGNQLRPDLLLAIENKVLYILESTVGFETNLKTNSVRKHEKCLPLTADQKKKYNEIKFINVSVTSLGRRFPNANMTIFVSWSAYGRIQCPAYQYTFSFFFSWGVTQFFINTNRI